MSQEDKDSMAADFNKIEDGLGDALLEPKEVYLMSKGDLAPDKMHEFVVLMTGSYFELSEEWDMVN